MGEQPAGFEGSRLWVVPNPSGLNAHETVPLAAAYADRACRRSHLTSPATVDRLPDSLGGLIGDPGGVHGRAVLARRPGGTAVAALRIARELALRTCDEVDLRYVAGKHPRRPTRSTAAGAGGDAAAGAAAAVRDVDPVRLAEGRVGHRCRRRRPRHRTDPVRDVGAAGRHVARHRLRPHPEKFTRHGVRVMTRSLDGDRAARPTDPVSQRGDVDDCLDARPRRGPAASRPARRRRRPATVAEIERMPGAATRLPERVRPVRRHDRAAQEPATADRADGDAGVETTLPLVVAGAAGWGDVRSLRRRRPTCASSASCPTTTSRAVRRGTVFAYPSEREGFGLPVAEAMAQGTPVVTSAGTSTEEVAGGAAVLVDPFDVDVIAAGHRRGARSTPTNSPRSALAPRPETARGRRRRRDPRRLPRAVSMSAARHLFRRSRDPAHASTIDVAVNLLWCVPGDVGGSEEYLVRQLLGLARSRPGSSRRCTACRRSSTRIPSSPDCSRRSTATITGDDRSRRVLAEHTWLARRTRRRPRPPRRRHRPALRWRTRRADHPRPAVRVLSRSTSAPTKLRYLRSTMPRRSRRAVVTPCPPSTSVGR